MPGVILYYEAYGNECRVYLENYDATDERVIRGIVRRSMGSGEVPYTIYSTSGGRIRGGVIR